MRNNNSIYQLPTFSQDIKKSYFHYLYWVIFEQYLSIFIVQIDGQSEEFKDVLKNLNTSFTVLFTIECIIKMIGLGLRVSRQSGFSDHQGSLSNTFIGSLIIFTSFLEGFGSHPLIFSVNSLTPSSQMIVGIVHNEKRKLPLAIVKTFEKFSTNVSWITK